jgi:precorrin-6B methylase 2
MSTQVEAEVDRDTPSTDQLLIQLLTGAWATQSVAAACKLSIPDALASGPMSSDGVAAKVGAESGAVYRLLRALASLGVFERRADRRFALTELGERLRKDAPGTLRETFIAETDHAHWQSWEKVADAVRTGLPRPLPVLGAAAFDYYGKNREDGEQFARAMQNVSNFAAAAVCEAYDFSGVKTVMDIGGGNGSMALAILEGHPQMQGRVFDLPYIEEHAHRNIAEAGAAHRCGFEAGDFFKAVPAGADLHILKFILHDWTDEECVKILESCRKALAPGGKVLLVEMLVPEEIRPDFVMLMDINMLVMTGGRERTAKEFEKVLGDAGFAMTRVITTKSPFALIEARPRAGL